MKTAWNGCVLTLLILGLPSVGVAQGLPSPDELSKPIEFQPIEEEKPEEPPPPVKPVEQPAQAEAQTAPAEAEEATVKAEAEGPAEAPDDQGRDERFVSRMMNLEGNIGLQHVASARGGAVKTYQVGLLAEFYRGANTVRFNDVDTLFGGNLLLQATPLEFLSASLRLQTRNNVNTFGRPQAMLSQGDTLLNVKGTFEPKPGIYLGADLALDFPTDFGTTGLRLAGTSVRPRALVTFDMDEMSPGGLPLDAHVNLGFRFDNSDKLIPEGVDVTRVERFAYNLSEYNFLEFALGFSYDLPYVTPFLAWNLAVPTGGADACGDPALECVSDVGFGAFPKTLSFGAKAEPVEHLGLHAGIDLGLTPDDAAGLPVTPPYNLVFGLSWTIDPTPKVVFVEKEVEPQGEVAAPQRFLVGTIIDGETQEPIPGAIVEYVDGSETPQASTSDGRFRSYGFAPAAKLSLSISHPDYEAQEVSLTLDEGEGEQELAIELVPAVKQGKVLGMVEDESGAALSRFSVKITGEREYSPVSTSDGKFEESVRAGAYTVAVSAEGYLTRGKDVVVDPDGKVDLTLVLKKAPKEKLVRLRDDKIEIQQKIFFATGKADILEKSHDLLDQVTALLAENPQIKRLQIEGHTDDVGSDEFNMDLSRQRAEEVRGYLIEQGVSPDRLAARGFGETRPILPNTSKRNRGINRRVEFNILER